jgi:hypothetical protein
MGRSFCLAVALTLCVLGLECLVVKRATLSLDEPPKEAATSYDYSFIDPTFASTPKEVAKRVIEPPEWAPFLLLSSGIVLLLYTKAVCAGG